MKISIQNVSVTCLSSASAGRLIPKYLISHKLQELKLKENELFKAAMALNL